jgi:hypothetical protein
MAGLECARQLLEVVEFNNKIVARIARLVHRWIWKYGRPGACRQDTVPNLHHTKRGNDDGQQINFNTTTHPVFLTYVTLPGPAQTCPVRFNIRLKVR